MKPKSKEPEYTIKGAPAIDDFQVILACAARYAIGRRTYMPGLVTDFIMNDVGDCLSPGIIHTMINDIARVPPEERGDACDRVTWSRFNDWLKAKLEELENGNEC